MGRPGGETSAEDSLAIDMLAVTKRFGETIALDRCTFSCRFGMVHALLGENGSGKSTAVKVAAGIVAPDTGAFNLRGLEVRRFSPRSARGLGVEAVLQEVIVIESLSVLDNLFLGYDGLLRRRVPRRERLTLGAAALEPFAAVADVDLGTRVEDLTLAQAQLIGIARALMREPRILVLDESTSALDVQSVDGLFGVLRSFTGEGGCVLFISHRLDEVMAIAQHVTVLRNGQAVASVHRSETSADALIDLMAGPQLPEGRPTGAI
jgi:ABC-type sugar transport system ATPase subunit